MSELKPTIDFAEMLLPTEYLPADSCTEGNAYYVSGRSCGAIAICVKVAEPIHGAKAYPFAKCAPVFESLREKNQQYIIGQESHYDNPVDSTKLGGTLKPYIDLGPAPQIDDPTKRMDWLLQKEIELKQAHLDWLTNFPEDQQRGVFYLGSVEDDLEDLTKLLDLQARGWDLPADKPHLFHEQIKDNRQDIHPQFQ